MPYAGVMGHRPDQKFPRVQINERLFEQIQGLIKPSWYHWEQLWMQMRPQYGVPVQLPHLMGQVETASGICQVWLHDGNKMMRDHDMDFNQGGNGYEDPQMCPKNIIILDANILFPEADDLPLIAMHEISEGPGDGDGKSMANGMTYDAAHKIANAKEHLLRTRAQSPQWLNLAKRVFTTSWRARNTWPARVVKMASQRGQLCTKKKGNAADTRRHFRSHVRIVGAEILCQSPA